MFTHHPWTAPDKDADEQQRGERYRADIERVQNFLRSELMLDPPVRYSRTTLEAEYNRLVMGRNDLRALIERETQTGALQEQELPKREQRGARKHYLRPGRPPQGEMQESSDGAV